MRIIGSIMSCLFGLLFAGAGGFMAMQTVLPTYESWSEMQHWQPAPATLLSVQGRDNETRARYRYPVDGRVFENDRVYVAAFKDNIGRYHQDLGRMLEQSRRSQEPITVWYNPQRPEESVIDREMRWGLFGLMSGFCGVFVLFGLFVCWIGCRSGAGQASGEGELSLRQLRKEWRERRSDPGFRQSFIDYCKTRNYETASKVNRQDSLQNQSGPEPWLQKKEWKQNRLRSGAKSSMAALWIFALVFIGVCAPLGFLIPVELAKQNYAILLVLLFPFAGLVLLKQAIQATREWRRFGVIELALDPFPGSIGGHVGGSFQITTLQDLNRKFEVGLECVYSYISGTGKNRSRRERVEWAEQGSAKVKPNATGIQLNFRFDVPKDLPEADIEQRKDYFYWRVQLRSTIDGIELKRSYNIPVFKTETESRFIRHDISAQSRRDRKIEADQSQRAILRGDLQSTGLARAFRFRASNHELRFYFPMFRNKLLGLIALIFGAGFGFAAVSMNLSLGDGAMGVVIALFSIPFGLVGIVGCVAAVYLPLNNLSVSINAEGIRAVRRLFIVPLSWHRVAAQDVSEIRVKSTGSTGQGVDQVKHFKLVVQAKNGKQFTLAEGIDGEDLAEQFRDFIVSNLGKSHFGVAAVT